MTNLERSPANKSQALKCKKSRKICETEKGHNKTDWRRIASPAGMKLVVRLTLCEVLLRIECLKAFLHAGVVNA